MERITDLQHAVVVPKQLERVGIASVDAIRKRVSESSDSHFVSDLVRLRPDTSVLSLLAFVARNLVEKRIKGADSPSLEDRDIHPRDNRSGSIQAEPPLQAAVIVIHLRGTYKTKHESRNVLKNVLDLLVDGIATDDLFLGLKERAIFRIEFADCDLAAVGIPLAKHFNQISFHQITEWVAQSLPPSGYFLSPSFPETSIHEADKAIRQQSNLLKRGLAITELSGDNGFHNGKTGQNTCRACL
jgi:hypothetical protein